MHLTPGQTLIWEKVSATECSIIVPLSAKVKPDPVAALNFAAEHGLETGRTDEWMKMLRKAR